MIVQCYVDAVIKTEHVFYVDVDDPTDDKKIDHVLYPAWEERMADMFCPYTSDSWRMKEWKLVDKVVIDDE